MKKKLLTERELEALHAEWAERRAENDNQAVIRLSNLAIWAALTVYEGGK